MSRKPTRFLLALICMFALALGAAACEQKKDGDADKKKTDEKATSGTEEPAGAGTDEAPTEEPTPDDSNAGKLEIPALGLVTDAPDNTQISELMGGHMLQGPDLVVTIEEIAPDDTMKPKTLEEAKESADLYSPQNIQEETLPDGWLMTFTSEGGMGTNYWVQSRREIGGLSFWCFTTATSEAQQQNAVIACKSLAAR